MNINSSGRETTLIAKQQTIFFLGKKFHSKAEKTKSENLVQIETRKSNFDE